MQHPTPTDQEVVYDGGIMITETDLHGRITFANRKFVEMSGYSKVELFGRPHSIVRHPDMPSCCFRNMWETIREGETWKGYIKNLRKDGAFYWAVVYVSPKINALGETVGYIAARKIPEPKTLETVKTWYAKLTDLEQCPESCEQAFVANMMQQELPEAL
jgi:PAS domain S-box-containing protein